MKLTLTAFDRTAVIDTEDVEASANNVVVAFGPVDHGQGIIKVIQACHFLNSVVSARLLETIRSLNS